MSQSPKLSPLQLELLKVYSFHPTEAELLEIKRFLGQLFAKKLINNIEEASKKKGITESDLENWLNGEDQ